jgi:hypothetical protein
MYGFMNVELKGSVLVRMYENRQLSAPDDGRKHRPKHVELTWNNKLMCIMHLVGYFRSWTL